MNKTPKRIDYSKKFIKQLKKAPLEIKIAFRKRFEMFLEDPFNPLFNNHQLSGTLKGYRSINITGDWRAIYIEEKGESEIVISFEMLGTHSQLYK